MNKTEAMGMGMVATGVMPACFFARRVALVCAVLLLLLTACGKKGPPVAPQQKPLAAVADLEGVLSADNIKLSWSHNPENWSATTYVVLMARQELPRPECADCPLAFEKTGSVPVDRSLRKEKHILDFSQSLAGGFHYSFRVRPVTASGAQGPDSNMVVIDVPASGGAGN
jgi:predicted small lipoprotein YifL